MINNNPNNIIIVGRKDDAPDPLANDALQRYAEDSEPEMSETKRMLALILLVLAVAGFWGFVGLVSFLAQL